MKILVGTTVTPDDCGDMDIAAALRSALEARGHQADIVNIPFSCDAASYMEQMLALRLYPVADHGDRLVCIGRLAGLLQHPQKYLWITRLPAVPPVETKDAAIAEYALRGEAFAFTEVEKAFAASGAIAAQLRDDYTVEAEILLPPAGPGAAWDDIIGRLTD